MPEELSSARTPPFQLLNQMASRSKWIVDRPHTLVVACSDGRLQDQTDEFLHGQLGLAGFDRFYVPGGGGALAASGPDFFRSIQMRTECAYLIKLHEVKRVILLFHGPSSKGPADACCADYRRKLPHSTPMEMPNGNDSTPSIS